MSNDKKDMKDDFDINFAQDGMEEEIENAIEGLKAAQAKLDELKTKIAAEKETAKAETQDQESAPTDSSVTTPNEPIDVDAQVVSGVDEKQASSTASVPEPAHPTEAAAAAVAAGTTQNYQQMPPQNGQASPQSQVQSEYSPPQGAHVPPQNQKYYYQPNYQTQTQLVSSKDHVAAGLLAIFLGWLGIHKFYLGYNTAGFIMLAVTVLGSIFTLGIACAVIWIIALIEGILYLTKSQSEFERTYVINKREWF